MAMEPMAAPQQAAVEPVQMYAPPEAIEPTAPRAPSAAPIEPVQAVAHPVVTTMGPTTVAPPVYVTPRAAQPVEPVSVPMEPVGAPVEPVHAAPRPVEPVPVPVEPVGAPVEPVQAAVPRVVITAGPTTVAPPVYVTPRAAQPVESVQAPVEPVGVPVEPVHGAPQVQVQVHKVEKIVHAAPQGQIVQRIVEVPQIRTAVLPASGPAVGSLPARAATVGA